MALLASMCPIRLVTPFLQILLQAHAQQDTETEPISQLDRPQLLVVYDHAPELLRLRPLQRLRPRHHRRLHQHLHLLQQEVGAGPIQIVYFYVKFLIHSEAMVLEIQCAPTTRQIISTILRLNAAFHIYLGQDKKIALFRVTFADFQHHHLQSIVKEAGEAAQLLVVAEMKLLM